MWSFNLYRFYILLSDLYIYRFLPLRLRIECFTRLFFEPFQTSLMQKAWIVFCISFWKVMCGMKLIKNFFWNFSSISLCLSFIFYFQKIGNKLFSNYRIICFKYIPQQNFKRCIVWFFKLWKVFGNVWVVALNRFMHYYGAWFLILWINTRLCVFCFVSLIFESLFWYVLFWKYIIL